jgi:rhodanese-related sulfurtransferase
MKEISVSELKQMQDNNEAFVLIDVREPSEFDDANLGGILIPLATVPKNQEAFPKEGKVIVHCRSGKRSGNAIMFLEQNHGYTNLYNLKGGILAWRDEIDPDLNVV